MIQQTFKKLSGQNPDLCCSFHSWSMNMSHCPTHEETEDNDEEEVDDDNNDEIVV